MNKFCFVRSAKTLITAYDRRLLIPFHVPSRYVYHPAIFIKFYYIYDSTPSKLYTYIFYLIETLEELGDLTNFHLYCILRGCFFGSKTLFFIPYLFHLHSQRQ